MSKRVSSSFKTYRKAGHPTHVGGVQRWEETELSDTLNIFDNSETRTPTLIVERRIDAGTQDQVLCLLFETYGTEEVVEWGINVLASLQQAEVLRQRMHESCVQSQAKSRKELDDGSLPCPELVAEWMLRDMWEREECGRSSQGWESAEQQHREPTKSLSELPHESPSSCKEMFDMWKKGKGIWILQQALLEIQEVWKSDDVLWKGGGYMKEVSTVVRRLTPL